MYAEFLVKIRNEEVLHCSGSDTLTCVVAGSRIMNGLVNRRSKSLLNEMLSPIPAFDRRAKQGNISGQLNLRCLIQRNLPMIPTPSSLQENPFLHQRRIQINPYTATVEAVKRALEEFSSNGCRQTGRT